MVRKLSILAISVTILAVGIVGFYKLNYWERSILVFKSEGTQFYRRGFNGHKPDFERRFERNRLEDSRRRFERQDFRNIPDSIRERFFSDRRFSMPADSLGERLSSSFPGNRDSFSRRNAGRSAHGRDFRRGRAIYLPTVGWFLSVFAAVTVVTVYIDNVWNRIRKRIKRRIPNMHV